MEYKDRPQARQTETYNKVISRLKEAARNKLTPVSMAKKAIPVVGQAMAAKDIYDIVTSVMDVLGSEGVLNRTPDIDSVVSKIQQSSTKGRLKEVSKKLLPTHDDKAVVDRIASGWRDVDPSMLKQQQRLDRETIDSSIIDSRGYSDDMWDSLYQEEAPDYEGAEERVDEARVEEMQDIFRERFHEAIEEERATNPVYERLRRQNEGTIDAVDGW
tara:strand:- start:2543 stop:3187 length:645 start_codon:yes stop_codon:yes gene_type:complete